MPEKPRPKSGETEATANGKQIHKNYRKEEADGKFRREEFTLPSGSRVDFIDFEKKIIYELKPNNARQIRLGKKQLERYKAGAEKEYGPGWKVQLDTY